MAEANNQQMQSFADARLRTFAALWAVLQDACVQPVEG